MNGTDGNLALAAAIAHYKRLGTPHFDVPEWIVNDAPLRVWWKPLTSEERDELWSGGASPEDVDVVIRKALDEAGKPIFSLADRPVLRRVSANVLTRMATKLLTLPSAEDIEKN